MFYKFYKPEKMQ